MTVEDSHGSLSRGSVGATDRSTARNTLGDQRRLMPANARHAAQSAIDARLRTLVDELDLPTGTTIGAYQPIRGEPNLQPVWQAWFERGFVIGLPRVVAKHEPLVFGRWQPGIALKKGVFDVPEPDPFEPVVPSLLVMPCLGFDPRGYRLGYGAGFYDRTLAALGAAGIGVAFDAAEVSGFEPAPHDVPLLAIVTDRRTLRFDREGVRHPSGQR